MIKFKNQPLFVGFLVVAGLFCFSTVSAKTENERSNGAEHRSTVSTSVQKLLEVADREKGEIGDEVKAVAQAQNEVKDKVADAIDKVQNRSKVKTFFLGTDYKNLGQLRSEMVKGKNQVRQLKRLLEKATSPESRAVLEEEIKTLEESQQKLDNFLKTNESKFSLFGWFVKKFSK
jgi:vacuolar-type H+-ATPase subunit I/STV1